MRVADKISTNRAKEERTFRMADFGIGGFRCQVSGKRNIEAETCWSEAEIPSEAKRQRGTLKP